MINENSNNPRKLFSTIDCLLNNKPANCLDQPSLIMCEDFVIFFNNKITQIRTDIAHTSQSFVDELGSYPYHKMEMFRIVNKDNILQIISQLNSSSSCLDSIPTVFF